ncbi:MAG: GNAT family N-acetyltransferase [Deltaproteobacteria bacterium]|nr:GNAT family N-acetyltransferase [Deltaproteobacteria bacterium]
MREVRALRQEDDRSSFRSGNPDLDRFFSCYAGQNQFRHHVGVTYVAVVDREILGFATVAAAQVEIADLPGELQNRLPRYPLPVLRLARLAVDERAQGQGIGKMLLRAMFSLAREMASAVGCVGVVVDAKPAAVGFYKELGFRELVIRSGALGDRPEPLPLYLHLSAIPQLVGP